MTSLSDKAGYLIAANLIKYAIGFVLPMVLVRLLSQEDYGTYQQLLLVGNTLAVLVLGLPTSVYYFYQQDSAQRRPALIVQTAIMLGVSGVAGAAIVFLAAEPIARTLNNPGMGGLLQVYALSIAFVVASEHVVGLLIVQDRYRLAVALEVGESAVRVALLLAPLMLGYGLAGLVAGVVLFAALRYVVRTASTLASPGIRFAGWPANAFALEQLAYCAPLALSSVAWIVGSSFNKGIVAAHFAPAAYAIYAVGALEIPLDVIFQVSVHNILRASLPPLVRDGQLAEVARLMRESTRKLAIIVVPSFVFLLSFSREFITGLFTADYAESVDIFRIYLFAVPLHMLVLSPIPQVFGKTHLHLGVNLLVIAALIALSYLFLQFLGLYGPALAWTVSQYIGVVAFFGVVMRLTRAPLARLLPVGALARITAASLVAALVAKIADGLADGPLGALAIGGMLFAAGFLAAASLLGVFTANDRDLIRRWTARLTAARLS